MSEVKKYDWLAITSIAIISQVILYEIDFFRNVYLNKQNCIEL